MVLPLSAYPQLVRGSEVRLEKEPVRALSCSLHDVKGKEVSVCRSPVGNVAKKDSEESRGTISLTFRLAPLHRSPCTALDNALLILHTTLFTIVLR